MTATDPTPTDGAEVEALAEVLEDAMVAYDEDGRVFGTSGAGAYFLGKHLAPVVADMLATVTAERDRARNLVVALEGELAETLEQVGALVESWSGRGREYAGPVSRAHAGQLRAVIEPRP
jgi:hypothetical protein